LLSGVHDPFPIRIPHIKMAAHATADFVSLDAPMSDDESLSDEQIQTLLREAEGRLRQNPSLQPKPFNQESTTLPAVNVDSSIQPCIDFTKGAARVDPLYLRKQQNQDLAERIRTVETDSARKQRLKQVCYCHITISILSISQLCLRN
jgi:hypothetical protein